MMNEAHEHGRRCDRQMARGLMVWLFDEMIP